MVEKEDGAQRPKAVAGSSKGLSGEGIYGGNSEGRESKIARRDEGEAQKARINNFWVLLPDLARSRGEVTGGQVGAYSLICPLFYFEGMMEGWSRIKDGAKYSGVKERTFRDWLKDGLKHSRLPSGTILIKYEWIDTYLEAFAAKEDQVDKIVNETVKEMEAGSESGL